MKKILSTLGIALMLTTGTVHAQEVNQKNPYEMIQDVAMRTFDRIKENQASIKNDPEQMRTIMQEELLPYVDYKFAAYKVLGKYASKVDRDELQEFVKVFREYLITTYAVAMNYYDDQEVIFEPASDVGDSSYVVVRAIVKDPNRPEIKVAFKLRKDSRTNEWGAFDMVAEGISLLDSKRSEFESIIRQDGIQKVIELMQSKISNPVELEEEMDLKEKA
nr:ABC transporter substrate-binding protein [Salinimonas chungwhensis]